MPRLVSTDFTLFALCSPFFADVGPLGNSVRGSGRGGENSAVSTMNSGDVGDDESVVGGESVGNDRESGGGLGLLRRSAKRFEGDDFELELQVC